MTVPGTPLSRAAQERQPIGRLAVPAERISAGFWGFASTGGRRETSSYGEMIDSGGRRQAVAGRSVYKQTPKAVTGRRLYNGARWRSLKSRRPLNLLWAPAFQYSIIPPFLPAGSPGSKQCQTNPIRPSGRQAGSADREMRKTNPISARGRRSVGQAPPCKCAKRTQFGPSGLPSAAKGAKRTQFPAVPGGTGPGGRGAGAKRAKRTQFPPVGQGPGARKVQNEPNLEEV